MARYVHFKLCAVPPKPGHQGEVSGSDVRVSVFFNPGHVRAYVLLMDTTCILPCTSNIKLIVEQLIYQVLLQVVAFQLFGEYSVG